MPGGRLSKPAALFLLSFFKCFFINRTDTYWNLNVSDVLLKLCIGGCQMQSLIRKAFFFSEFTIVEKYSENFITFDFGFDEDWLDTRCLVGKTSLTHVQNFLGFKLFSSIKFLLYWLLFFFNKLLHWFLRILYLDQ